MAAKRFGLWLVMAAWFVLAVVGCDGPGKPEPTSQNLSTQGELLSDVAIRRDQLRTTLESLQQLAEALDAARQDLSQSPASTSDYKSLRARVEELATPPPLDPKAPYPPLRDERALDEVSALFDAEYDRLSAVIERFAPSFATEQGSFRSPDDGSGSGTAEIYYRLNGNLGRSVPRSATQCRGFGAEPGMPVAYRGLASRAAACLDLLGELERDWRHRASEALKDELDLRKKRVDRSIKSVDNEITAKDAEQQTLRENLRSATSLDTLVKWGFPAMAGVVALLFLIVRSFKETLQELIVTTRLLVDVIIVLVLVTTLLILGLAKSLTSEVLGTLMSGIIGYTLGRTALGDRARVNGAVPASPHGPASPGHAGGPPQSGPAGPGIKQSAKPSPSTSSADDTAAPDTPPAKITPPIGLAPGLPEAPGGKKP